MQDANAIGSPLLSQKPFFRTLPRPYAGASPKYLRSSPLV